MATYLNGKLTPDRLDDNVKQQYGDGNDGQLFYNGSLMKLETDAQFDVSIGGTTRYDFRDGFLRTSVTNGWRLLREGATATNPNLCPRGEAGDLDTGIGAAGEDQLSLISGSVEGGRVTLAGGIITTRLSDNFSLSNTAEGNTGALDYKTTREVHTLANAATSDTTTISVPSGAILLAASFNVNTAVVDDGGDDTWSAAFITGDTSTLATAAAAAQDTKVDTSLVPVKTTDVAQVRFTANGGSFTSGVIEVQVYYRDLTSLASV